MALIDINAVALAALVSKSMGDQLTAAEWNTLTDSVQEANAATRTANHIYAGPTSGAAAAGAFRALVAADIPAIAIAGVTGLQAALDLKATDSDLDALAATLAADYTTTADLTTLLGDYYTSAQVDTLLADYDTSLEVAALLDTNATNDRARANHTGTQLAATISDFATAADARIAAASIAALADVPALGTAAQVLRVNAGATALEYASLGALAALDTVVNAQVAAGAAIAVDKLAALTASRALYSNASGVITAHAGVTDTELGYLDGVTSAIQTQIDAKATNPMTAAADLIVGGASGVPARLAKGTALQVLRVNAGATALEFGDPAGGISGLNTNRIPKATSATAIGDSLLADDATNVTLTSGQMLLPAGSASLPALAFTLDPDLGLYRRGTNSVSLNAPSASSGTVNLEIDGNPLFNVDNTNGVQFSSILQPNADATRDIGQLTRRVDDFYAVKVHVAAANGCFGTATTISESITLSTGGATTNSSANLLPANSEILAVTFRITTSIAGVDSTSLQFGDATTAARFGSTATLTSGTTGVLFSHRQGSIATDAAGAVQVAAATLRLTLAGGADNTPSGGVVRVTVHYRTYTPPTS